MKNPIRKSFDARTDFPFLLVYKDTKSPQRELPDHLHDWYEIVYVYRGKGTFFIDQTFHEMQQGDVFVIPGNTIHRAIPDKEDPVTSTAIFFSPVLVRSAGFGDSFAYLKLFEKGKKRKNYKFSLEPTNRNILEKYMDSMMEEEQEKQPNGRNALVLWLHMILLYLNRNCLQNEAKQNTEPQFGPEWMKDVLAYIDQNLGDRLDLDTLAKKASVSPAHFSRVFKQLIGMNVTDYIAAKRIIAVKELLLNSKDKVNAIAGKCGFESMPHFYRTFKKQTRMTPAAYRKVAGGGALHHFQENKFS